MAEKKVYTNAEINAALKKALEAKGEDYVYEQDGMGGCYYAANGEPSCIVGHVAHALDPEMFKAIEDFESDYDKSRGDNSFRNVVAGLGLPFRDDQVRALSRVQQEQDTGTPWGTAVATEWIAALGERL
ncbi:hypothetical protein SEA_HORTUS1_107 [Microbacterium phage Hortus1]|nr:hypothetical protein SEA_HORTUS1_107 [Microbacterium phage Hortus1]